MDFPNFNHYPLPDGNLHWSSMGANNMDYHPMATHEVAASEALLGLQIDQTISEPSLRSIPLDQPHVYEMKDGSAATMGMLLSGIGDQQVLIPLQRQHNVSTPPATHQWTEQFAIARAQAAQWAALEAQNRAIHAQEYQQSDNERASVRKTGSAGTNTAQQRPMATQRTRMKAQ